MNGQERRQRKELEGTVMSNKMNKTVTVRVFRRLRHPYFDKIVDRFTKCYAHTEETIPVGSQVRIRETRPLSKLKRWIVVEVKGQ